MRNMKKIRAWSLMFLTVSMLTYGCTVSDDDANNYTEPDTSEMETENVEPDIEAGSDESESVNDDGMIVEMDSAGERVVSITLSEEKAAELQGNLTDTKRNTDLVIDSAKETLQEYVDIEYYLDAEITNEGDFYYVTLTEENSGRETGAKGDFVYFTNGVLYSAAFEVRTVDFPENEEIISAEEAYDIAYEAVKAERDDLELVYDFTEEAASLNDAEMGQVYNVEIWGSRDEDLEIYCSCTLYAVTGEMIEMAYSDY